MKKQSEKHTVSTEELRIGKPEEGMWVEGDWGISPGGLIICEFIALLLAEILQFSYVLSFGIFFI